MSVMKLSDELRHVKYEDNILKLLSKDTTVVYDHNKVNYNDEYLAWVIDFDIPFTNNLSERSLCDAKSKIKISGQFQNEKTASYYANIKSYIETCNRNGFDTDFTPCTDFARVILLH
ncbi:MAG: hypothetical protein Ta2F_16190 [Termitinemataceae bacterium]|nr:MAG: hypothetical protein Ta2F_16190 [Termitinemataceae bacterium]